MKMVIIRAISRHASSQCNRRVHCWKYLTKVCPNKVIDWLFLRLFCQTSGTVVQGADY